VKLFFDLVTAEDAYRAIGAFAPLGTETIDCRTAAGRVVAEHVCAEEDVPHYERSNMDGFAVRAEDTYAASETSSAVLEIVGQVTMGEPARDAVVPGTAVRVSTGAMLPPGADAVVIVEKTEETADGRVAVRESAVPGQNLIRVGEDLRKGEAVFSPGRRLKGGDVGALTGVGRSTVQVYSVPRVGVIATGDEIVEPGQPLELGQVRNVNEYALASLARLAGAHVNDYGVAGDDESRLTATLARAVAANDVVFISGGSSKGNRDLTRAAIESTGARVLLHGIAIAPGKPTILARTDRCAIMGLPGNPAAAVVVFALFGSTLVRVIGGEPLARILLTRPTVRARVAEAVTSTQGREDYVRVRLDEGDDGRTVAVPLRGKSVAISTVARADGLLRIPLSSDGVVAGAEVDVLLL
jgi:molybdopterin molybdotransferase